jgi:hypothetical protein
VTELTEDRLNELSANDYAKALEQWYDDAVKEHGPFGRQGRDTSSADLWKLFAAWYKSHETRILGAICPKWHQLGEKKKEAGLHAMILAIAALLESASLGLAHVSATAVLIGCKWGMDGRCAVYKSSGDGS